MTLPEHMSAREHRRVSTLLPWVVNGTLEGRERERTEQHLRDCLECRRELRELRTLARAVHASDGAPSAPKAALSVLLARIEAGERAPAPLRERLRAWLQRFRHLYVSADPLVRWGAAVPIALLAALLAWAIRPAGPDATAAFRTLSTPTREAPHAGAAVRLVFAPDITAAQIRNILNDVDATIVAGPTRTGIYTVAVPGATAAPTIERLRTHAGVVLAEPVGPHGRDAR